MHLDLTVIIPYYNECDTIVKTLNQLNAQTYRPKNILLINSSSSDNTSEFIDNWISNNNTDLSIKNIFKNTKFPSSSKNVGINLSNTKYLAFMDCNLNFNSTWLEEQYEALKRKKIEIIFGCVELSGISSIDICAVAHTYGYKKECECIPGTILEKNVINKVGNFTEQRSGYDQIWRKAVRDKKIRYDISNKTIVTYMDINYADNYKDLLIKTVKYTFAQENVFKDRKNLILLFLSITFIMLLFLSSKFFLYLLLIYLIARSYLLTIIKSKKFFKTMIKLHIFFNLPITSIIIDCGKMFGSIKSYLQFKENE